MIKILDIEEFMDRSNRFGEENVWEEDIKALDFAIAALKISSHNL